MRTTMAVALTTAVLAGAAGTASASTIPGTGTLTATPGIAVVTPGHACTWAITNRPPNALFQIVGVRASRPGLTGMVRVTYKPTGAFVAKALNTSTGGAAIYTGRHGVPSTPAPGTLVVTIRDVVCAQV